MTPVYGPDPFQVLAVLFVAHLIQMVESMPDGPGKWTGYRFLCEFTMVLGLTTGIGLTRQILMP